MITGIWEEINIRVEFACSPLFEMLAAMHVFYNPAHHIYRAGWYERVSGMLPSDLAEKIRRLGEETGQWLIPMDFAEWEGMEALTVPEALEELGAVPLSCWNLVFGEYGQGIGSRRKRELLETMRAFYDLHFAGEYRFLEPFLKRILEKECRLCEKRGLLAEADSIHERLEVTDGEIIFHKNRDYRFRLEELDRIRIWGSTFLAPHLMMGTGIRYLSLVLPVLAEERRGEVPVDLLRCMSALGDRTRLRILRELRRKPLSTKELSAVLSISEAAVSKQLKLLTQAGLADKRQQGRFVLYEIKPETVDFITYRLYEFLG